MKRDKELIKKIKHYCGVVFICTVVAMMLFTCQLKVNKLREKGNGSIVNGIAKDIKGIKQDFESGYED